MMKRNVKIIVTAFLIIASLFSMTIISKYASSPKTYSYIYKKLDDKKLKVMGITTTISVASTVIAAVPGDSTTPIANQLSQLINPLLLIICAIYLEKFLLTTIGFLVFTIFLPLSALIFCIGLFNKKNQLYKISLKILIFSVVIYGVIPTSILLSDMIENTFDQTISQVLEPIENINSEDDSDESNIILDFLSKIEKGTTAVVETAKNVVSMFIDAIAVLIVTTCVIPLLVIYIFIKLVKILFNIEIKIPDAFKIKRMKKLE